MASNIPLDADGMVSDPEAIKRIMSGGKLVDAPAAADPDAAFNAQVKAAIAKGPVADPRVLADKPAAGASALSSLLDKDGMISDPALIAKIKASGRFISQADMQKAADDKTAGGSADAPVTTFLANALNTGLANIPEGIQGAIDYARGESSVNHKKINSWQEGRENVAAIDDARSRQNQIASGLGTAAGIGGAVGGAMLTGGASAEPLLARGLGGIARTAAEQAGIGGAYGGTDAFMHGESGGDVLNSALTGAALGGVAPFALRAAEPVINKVGELAGGVKDLVKNAGRNNPLGNPEELVGDTVNHVRKVREDLKTKMNDAYDALNNAPGQFDPTTWYALGPSMRGALDSANITPLNAPGAHATIDQVHQMMNYHDPIMEKTIRQMNGMPADSTLPIYKSTSLGDVNEARRYLSDQIRYTNDPTDKMALIKAKEAFDDHVGQMTTGPGGFQFTGGSVQPLADAQAAAKDYYGKFGARPGDNSSLMLSKVLDRNASPQEAARMILGTGAVGTDGNAMRNLQRLGQIIEDKENGPGKVAWDKLRQGLWAQTVGGDQSKAQLSASISSMLRSPVAGQLYKPNEIQYMQSLVKAPNLAGRAADWITKQMAGNVGGIGAMMNLASGNLHGVVPHLAAALYENAQKQKLAGMTRSLHEGVPVPQPNANLSLPIGVGYVGGQGGAQIGAPPSPGLLAPR